MIAIAAWWSRSRRGDRDRGEVIAISARWSWLREDDRDWGAILKSRISDPKVRIASLAIKSRSQRSYNDLSPMIAARFRKIKYPRFQVWIAILAMKSRSQRHCTYRGVLISIAAKIERSWRSYSDLSGMIVIAGRWLRSRRQTAFFLARWY